MPNDTTRFLTEHRQPAGSVTLNVARTGPDSPDVIFLHGVTRRWQSFLPIVSSLAVRYQLELIDLRGHGDSSRAPSYQVRDYVGDVVKRLGQLTNPVVLYGHSLGAMVAAAAAAQCPEQIRGVVLEDPPFETMGARIGQTRLLSYFQGVAELVGSRASFESYLARLPAIRLVDPATGCVQRVGDVRDEVFLRFTARSLTRLDPLVLNPIVAGSWLDGFDYRGGLANIRSPVLLMRADPNFGGMLSAEDVRWCRRELPQVTCLEFSKTPHLIHIARPAEVATQVLGFVESLAYRSD
ncbi:MAG: alpha/beta fold hydrolase [Planctomycetaceae bacterium]|jgi:pimeloyl-ACP methyl ester carboxylesterase